MVDPIQSSHNEETKNNIHGEFKVTPWEVEGEIDYNKLIEKFGTQIITPEESKRSNWRNASNVKASVLLFPSGL